jgi:hypothetical protein
MGGVVDRVSEIIWNISQDAFEDGRKKERERIIELLEELAYVDEDGHEMVGEFKSDLIALIKGEQK